jgi:hypothetical protein
MTRSQSLAHPNAKQHFEHPLQHCKTGKDCIVNFVGPKDPYNPTNWPFRKKCVTTLLYGLTTLGSTSASAIYSPASRYIENEFHISHQVAVLGTTLFMLGFGTG